jgi:hypothetical protein
MNLKFHSRGNTNYLIDGYLNKVRLRYLNLDSGNLERELLCYGVINLRYKPILNKIEDDIKNNNNDFF